MIITDIKIQKGHLYEICCESGFTFLLDRDFCDRQGLKKGDNLSEEDIKKLKEESEYIRAKNRALWFLDRGDRSEKVLLEKIVSGKIQKDAAIKAIARLKEVGLVDNRRYAENLTAYYLEKNASRRQIYAKLLEKGIPSALANEVLKQTEFDEVAEVKALVKKKYANKLNDKQEFNKTVAALMRRGFNYGSIKAALKEYQFESEEYF